MSSGVFSWFAMVGDIRMDNYERIVESQPVNAMGPNELEAYAALGDGQHDEANKELERRWSSYDDMLPHDEFVSIIDKAHA